MIHALVMLIAFAFGSSATESRTVTWTGWFSDKGCAAGRVEKGDIGPNGTLCVRKCLEKGETPVFISEQAKAMFEVKDYPQVKDDVGFHIELTGIIDDVGKSIAVTSVTRLSEVGNLCALPRKKPSQE
jgi:hypothetical protein